MLLCLFLVTQWRTHGNSLHCICQGDLQWRNTEPTAPTLSTQVTTVTLPDKQGQAEARVLIAFWVLLTNRWFLGWSGDLSEMPGDHRWCVCNKEKKHLRTASHPHLKWKIGNFMQEKKRLRLTWLARSHRCSVNTHGKPVLIFLLANTTTEPKQLWKSYAAVSTDLWGPSKLHGTKQSTWKDFQQHSSPWMMVSQTVQLGNMWTLASHLSLSGAAQQGKSFCLWRTNTWHDCVCWNGFI